LPKLQRDAKDHRSYTGGYYKFSPFVDRGQNPQHHIRDKVLQFVIDIQLVQRLHRK
jgi:hypothetical protein